LPAEYAEDILMRLLPSRLATGKYAEVSWRNEISCGTNSVVECNLAKVEVAGSNPVSRSFVSTIWKVYSRLLPNNYPVKLIHERGREPFDCFAPDFERGLRVDVLINVYGVALLVCHNLRIDPFRMHQ